MRSEARTPKEYLDGLRLERRKVVASVRKLVRAHIAKGFKETVNWGMLVWEVPLSRYPDTYNGQPLSYVALAAQKNYYALYLHGVYMDEKKAEALKKAYAAAGKKLDMGKSCLRFKREEDLLPEAVAAAVEAMDVDGFVAAYEKGRSRRRR